MTELALYIDIEGFGAKFEQGGKQSFIDLTNDLFQLGQSQFRHLSIIQFGGDGFLIKEILTYSNDLNKFIEIAVTLLQAITLRGGVGRAQISHGYMTDVSGLYSKNIQSKIGKEGYENLLGESQNVMLISTVIGTSIINCYKLKGPAGSLLLIDKCLLSEAKEKFIHYNQNGYDVYGFNWVNYESDAINRYLKTLDLTRESLITKLKAYIDKNELKEEWKKETEKLINPASPPRKI